MEKSKLRAIADDTATHDELLKFDDSLQLNMERQPDLNFTSRVMNALPTKASGSSSYQLWGIIAGVLIVFVLWAIEGFSSPTLTLNVNYFDYLKIENIELTGLTKGFMMANGLLALLLVERWLHRRKLAK